MRPLDLVAFTPVFRGLSDIFQGCEDSSSQHLVTDGVVMTLEIGILVRLCVFDLGEGNALRREPRALGYRDDFRLIIPPQQPRSGITVHQVVEEDDHKGTRQRGFHLEREHFPIAIAEDIQLAIGSPAIVGGGTRLSWSDG